MAQIVYKTWVKAEHFSGRYITMWTRWIMETEHSRKDIFLEPIQLLCITYNRSMLLIVNLPNKG
jgi:hypothetical protein